MHDGTDAGARTRTGVLLALLAALALALVAAPPAGAAGPTLAVPQRDLDASLVCTASVDHATEAPVLLIPGTTLTPRDEFSWSWEPALRKLGRPYCTVELPGHAMGDIQTSAEYVVHAIRAVHERAGRRIAIVGHSQGGMIGRWALKYWPDTRGMVDDLVGLAPSNHGTILAPAVCLAGGCAPAFWQQRRDARFIAALNDGPETFPGISYTSVYSRSDEVVIPNTVEPASSALHGGGGRIANVPIQDVCPTDVAEHLTTGTSDNVAYRVALDALTHDGPADPARIDRSECLHQLQPGVDPLTFATSFATMSAVVAEQVATSPHVPAEPALRCYVTSSCPDSTATSPATRARTVPRVRVRVARRGARRVRVAVTVTRGATGRVRVRLLRGRVRAARATVRLSSAGRAVRTLTLRPAVARRALTVRVRYLGDAGHRPRSASARLRTH